MKMTLQETTKTLLGWLESCKNEDQIGLVDQAINVFILHRFLGDKGLPDAVAALMVAMKRKSQSLAPYSLTEENMN